MVQVYADGVLIYDPYMDGNELLELKATVNTDKGGTAEIVMPPYHPAYDSFVNQRTIVEIYRDGKLKFRGRALYPTDGFDGIRTITCEGERCFLRDAVIEPYLYQADPRVIFTDAISKYNAQVDSYKRFRIGAVTVRDPNDYQYIKCEDASYVSDVIDKLVEYCGGYVTFTTDSDGQRCINWLDSLDRRSGQTIEFGENLLDYSRTDANTELATVIYPYGKKDEETGVRIDIKAVNGGKPYIKDSAAIAKHGWIAQVVFWDDVTLAKNLMTKAKQYLATSTQVISTLELTALDMSAVDKDIDSFDVGDNVHILSRPHGVDDLFLLRERSYDFLDPSQDTVVLGKDIVTLTRSTTASEKSTATKLSQSGASVTNTYIIGSSEGGGSSGTTGVESVNGMSGKVTLTAGDVGAAADDHTHTPASIGAATANHTHTPASIGAAAANHTHDFPVTSVNGMTGDVVIEASSGGSGGTAVHVVQATSTYTGSYHVIELSEVTDQTQLVNVYPLSASTVITGATVDSEGICFRAYYSRSLWSQDDAEVTTGIDCEVVYTTEGGGSAGVGIENITITEV